MQEYFLPRVIRELTNQVKVPIGIFAVAALDTAVGFESCEELFTPLAPHIALSLDGIEIIANGSGSHHQLRKLQTRIDLVRGATDKVYTCMCGYISIKFSLYIADDANATLHVEYA